MCKVFNYIRQRKPQTHYHKEALNHTQNVNKVEHFFQRDIETHLKSKIILIGSVTVPYKTPHRLLSVKLWQHTNR
jgi:hypothetical protein